MAAGEAVVLSAADDDDFAAALTSDELGAVGESLAEKLAKTGFCVLEFPLGLRLFHTSQTSQSLPGNTIRRAR